MGTRTSGAVLAALVATTSPSWAAEGPRPGTLDLLKAAVERGYGDMCDLGAEKAAEGGKGYYRCLDVGPYRFTFEYGRVRGFVLVKGAAPFAIMEARDGDADFLVSGPWVRDLDARVEAWYADEVGGGRERREAADADMRRADEAGRAVEGYGQPAQGQGAGQQPQQPPYAPQAYVPPAYPPQVYAQPQYVQPQAAYAQPYAPQQAYPVRGGAAPDAYPLAAPSSGGDAANLSAGNGGRLIAPGVVQYGRGAPPPPGQ